jgi:hypothetical protein
MSVGSEMRSLSTRPVLRCLALVILFTISTRLDPLSSSVLDPDIWWHLRDGNSIMAQHAVPHQGWFTQYSSHSWVDYSWGSEVVMSWFHHWFGLMGLVVLRSSLEIAITLTIFLSLRRALRSFWQALPLTAVGMWAIHHCLGMQPMLVSVLMFTIELTLIFESRRRNTVGPLLWLPLLFLFWANLHIQFVYGLFVLLLLAALRLARAALPGDWSLRLQQAESIPLHQLLAIALVSVAATLVGPYSWRLYEVIFHYVRSSVPYMMITELQALNFRVPEHFVLVLIVAFAFLVLGWRRSRDPFKLALLAVCTVVGFRMTRDSWFCALPALFVIADREFPGIESEIEQDRRPRLRKVSFAAATAVLTVAMFVLVARDSKTSNASLARVVGGFFPANACAFLQSSSLQAPIYNDMNWGGFLIWALPDNPVAIDNRPDLYGDERLSRFYLVQQGIVNWRTDPDLNAAGVVLLNRLTPLAKLLAQNQHFHLIYEDAMAVVFIPDATNSSGNSGPASQKPQLKNEISSR